MVDEGETAPSRCRSITSKNSSGCIGFDRYPSIPAARHRASSPFIAWAVMAMIGRRTSVCLFALANHRGAFEAVHLRHLDVHEHTAESGNRRVIQDRERLTSVGRQDDRVPSLLEQPRWRPAG